MLGPIVAWSGGRQLSVGGPRQRCVLGALLLHLGREVTVDQLISYLWNDDPPRTARSVIQVQIHHLRQLLSDSIVTTSGGYLLDVAPESVDLHRFRNLRERAANAEPEVAVELLERALACWRGVPFSGVGSDFLEHSVVVPLREEWWSAVVAWASHALALGRQAEVVSRLTPMVSEEPFRERLHHLLITALWRDNERAKALAVYETFRTNLAEELGVDPGPELTALHGRILRDEARTHRGETPRDPEEGHDAGFVVRNDLPRDLPDFTGRREHLRLLEDVASDDDERAKVCVITGAGGEGKTTTAVRFGYESAKRFPDGQLFIDLYGYTANKEPLDPSSALAALLRAVGVRPESVPESLDERSALWRATLMGRRVLVILDNAASYAQVSPLLPSSPGSMTLITTRNDLSGLSGARFLSLGMFDEATSLELLERVVGGDRVRGEPEAARDIVRICGGLPLALRVIAGRMVSRPRWSFAHVARRLGERNRTFRELRVEGQSVESAIDLSYQSLTDDQRRAFLMLGLMIGNTVDLGGAAALLDVELEEADDTLQELVGVCLLNEPKGDVYRLHDLIRSFSLDRALTEFDGRQVESARTRLAGFYLETAQHAAELMGTHAHADADAERPRHRTYLSDREDAENWFSLHQENLTDTVEYFAAGDNGDSAWRLAESVWRYYALHGHMSLLLSSQQRAFQVSDRQGNRRGRAVTLIGLGIAHCLSGRFDESLEMLTEARDLLESVGDARGMIRALANLAMVYERLGRFEDARAAMGGVLEYAMSVGDTRVEALQSGNLAMIHRVLGEYREALDYCERALRKSSGDDNGDLESRAKLTMGEAHLGLGDLESAFRALNDAMERARRSQLVASQIYIHNALGVAHRAAGHWDQAVECHTEALALGEASGNRSGDAEIRTDLGMTHHAAGRHEEAAAELAEAHALAVERGERYIAARAALALGRLPEPVMPADRARALLRDAERTLAGMAVPEAEQARAALASLDAG
ncbi:BTAD domain-containing putative transcriptional regulator [Nocardiopsis sp. FIRDI 009]|uniref:AfsR/SARP family transcriptional regulator n=1 Tax=Nocardiopsis sp. FIRDI 009 TaxID=714197 RepID=UPI0018E56E2A|nr:BTAD domain-containing putative transcriptional regulator [Nocardiopsis sp. FIRDI 009]